jgi:hypothetical protein
MELGDDRRPATSKKKGNNIFKNENENEKN